MKSILCAIWSSCWERADVCWFLKFYFFTSALTKIFLIVPSTYDSWQFLKDMLYIFVRCFNSIFGSCDIGIYSIICFCIHFSCLELGSVGVKDLNMKVLVLIEFVMGGGVIWPSCICWFSVNWKGPFGVFVTKIEKVPKFSWGKLIRRIPQYAFIVVNCSWAVNMKVTYLINSNSLINTINNFISCSIQNNSIYEEII